MKILFHLPILPPKNPKFEAYSQEIEALSEVVDGKTIYINPNQYLPPQLPIRIPRLLFGFHNLAAIRRLDAQVDLHQIYNPDPFYYPVLSFLRKPIIYVLGGSVAERKTNPGFYKRLSAATVYDDRSYQHLCNAGIQNAYHVTSGIDTGRFTHSPLALDSTLHLLMASAPWTEAQFQTKGIEALLGAAKAMPKLQLTFLWRGTLRARLEQRIEAFGVGSQITVIDELVDVNKILATVHGTVLLASSGDLVKAFPHSLLDTLAAGKPIITSRSIPMADYVEVNSLGAVVEQVDSEHARQAIQKLMVHYAEFASNAAAKRAGEFTIKRMIRSYHQVYEQVLSLSPGSTPKFGEG